MPTVSTAQKFRERKVGNICRHGFIFQCFLKINKTFKLTESSFPFGLRVLGFASCLCHEGGDRPFPRPQTGISSPLRGRQAGPHLAQGDWVPAR